MPTNFERWQTICQNLKSPQTWIDFGFYFTITACLQRRVWFSLPPHQMFPNLYIVNVGPPATGKGLVNSVISLLLKEHRIETGQLISTNLGKEKPLLYPNGADCITFEQLLAKLASSGRRFTTIENQPYFHTSMWFALEELASMFKLKTSDVIRFLQNAYDCKDYDYEIKHQDKKDRIRNLCLSFIAGTQVPFLIEAQNKGLFDQGWSSRVIFLFENHPRFIKFHIAETWSEDQQQAKTELSDWIKKLSTVHGRVTYDKETYDFLEDWYVNTAYPRINRSSPRFGEYLGRIPAHVLKLACALHFADNLTLEIPLDTVKQAIEVLKGPELTMEAGLALLGRNPLHQHSRKMMTFIRNRKEVPEGELILQFAAELNVAEIMLCIKELELGFNLKSKTGRDGKKMYYL